MEPTRISPSAERIAQLLTYLARHPDQRFTMSALARDLGMNKATTHTLLQTLTKHGFLLRHPEEKAYRLGPALVGLGEAAALDEHEAAEFARAEMGRLSDELSVSCWAGAALGDEIIILARVAPDGPMRANPRVGTRYPFIAPVGAVFVAWADMAEVSTWMTRAGEPTPSEHDYYYQALRDIRTRGFAVNLTTMPGSELAATIEQQTHSDPRRGGTAPSLLSLDFLRGLQGDSTDPANHAVANLIAPVFHADGHVLLSLTIEAQIGQPDQDLMSYAQRLLKAAAEITSSIHGVPPDGWPGAEFMPQSS